MTERKPRVLLVEDEGMIAMLIEDMLVDLGFEVAETAARLDNALRAAETGSFDLALLDLNLDGTESYPVADILRARDIPIIFASGYGSTGLGAAYAGTPILQKPFHLADLEAATSRALSPGPDGRSSIR